MHRFTDIDAPSSGPSTIYDLIANVIHESAAGTTRDKESTVWKVHLRAGGGGGDNEQWFQIQDLIVEEIRKEMIVLGETMLQVRVCSRRVPTTMSPKTSGAQVWERRPEGAPTSGMDVDKS